MTAVALVSLKGGTGRTTLTALLATALARRRERAWAVELDPQGALALHLGLRPGPLPGLTDLHLDGADLATPGAASPYLSFGTAGPEAVARIEAELARDPSWLRRRLGALAPDAGADFVLLDVPAGPTPWLRAALTVADAALVVLLPDAASYATLPATEALFAAGGPPRAYVVNQLDGRRPLCADVVAAMRRTLGARVLPGGVHADERVRECLALGTPLLAAADGSQVAVDLEPLVEWLTGLREAAAPEAVLVN